MIRHILSDGRVVESVEGLVIPPIGPTATVYRIAAEFLEKQQKRACSEKEDKGGAKCLKT